MADNADDEDNGMTAIWVSLAHGLAAIIAWRFCRRRWAANARPVDGDLQITEAQLRPKRSLMSAYYLWTVGGFFGVHHFYLGRFIHGLLALWSLNLCGLGFFLDAFMMPLYVRGFNANCSKFAPMDRSRRILFCRLPIICMGYLGLVAGFILYFPQVLHLTGVLDIDRLSAQTAANPYVTLGIPWTASLSDAKAAYRKESLRWHPDRNLGCGKECENKMSEITKAFELIKRKAAPPPEDRTWEAWLKNLGGDWLIVLEAASKKDDDATTRGAATR